MSLRCQAPGRLRAAGAVYVLRPANVARHAAQIKASFRAPVFGQLSSTRFFGFSSGFHDRFERHGRRPSKTGSFPRYRKRPREWGLFYGPSRLRSSCGGTKRVPISQTASSARSPLLCLDRLSRNAGAAFRRPRSLLTKQQGDLPQSRCRSRDLRRRSAVAALEVLGEARQLVQLLATVLRANAPVGEDILQADAVS
jgi:hypothetical protein